MYLGVDIGSTKCRVAAFRSLNDTKIRGREHFPMTRTYEKDMPKLLGTIKKLVGTEKLEGIGCGTHGFVDSTGSTITGSGSLAGWHYKPIRQDIQTAVQVPVFIANDAEVAALAEALYGPLTKRNFWFIIWGGGVGGSYVHARGGKPHIFTSEHGHQILDWKDGGLIDGFGVPGSLETFVGGAFAKERYGKPLEELPESAWPEIIDHWTHGLYNLLTVRPAGYVVFGGGVANKQAKRLAAIQKNLRQLLTGLPVPKISLVSHGEDAGLVGALALLRYHLTTKP